MIKITVDGIAGLQAELKQKVNPSKIGHALELGVLLMEAEAKRYCPVRTGRLQQSITHHKVSNLTYDIMATANYADYVEYGTMYMPAGTPEEPYIYRGPVTGKYPSYRPFLRSAVYNKFDSVVKLIENSLNDKNERE